MEYYKFEDKEIIKYNVKFDLMSLICLKSDIISRCGDLKHRSYDTDCPNSINKNYIYNYKEDKIGTIDYFEESRDYFHVEYDEIIVPELAILIDDLIDGGLELIPYLLDERKFPESEISDNLKKELLDRETLLNELSSSKYKSYDEIIKLCKEIKEISGRIVGNSGKERQTSFLPRVKKVVSLTEIDRLDIETYNKYNNFFDINNGKVLVKKKDFRD